MTIHIHVHFIVYETVESVCEMYIISQLSSFSWLRLIRHLQGPFWAGKSSHLGYIPRSMLMVCVPCVLCGLADILSISYRIASLVTSNGKATLKYHMWCTFCRFSVNSSSIEAILMGPFYSHRAGSRFCNDVSHWLGASLESALSPNETFPLSLCRIKAL